MIPKNNFLKKEQLQRKAWWKAQGRMDTEQSFISVKLVFGFYPSLPVLYRNEEKMEETA